jgi:TolA-binding protein
MTTFRTVSIGVVLGLWVISGCGQTRPEELFAAAEEAAAESASREQAVQQFTAFLERFAGHELAPKALKRLAMIAQQQGDMRKAIAYYERLLLEYAACDQADEAQFMIAFIYEEYIKDLDQAREAYQRVIDNYPDSELAVSAQWLLPNVGRNPEEWVEFQNGTYVR